MLVDRRKYMCGNPNLSKMIAEERLHLDVYINSPAVLRQPGRLHILNSYSCWKHLNIRIVSDESSNENDCYISYPTRKSHVEVQHSTVHATGSNHLDDRQVLLYTCRFAIASSRTLINRLHAH